MKRVPLVRPAVTSPAGDWEIRWYVDSADRLPCLNVWLRASRVGHPFLSETDLAAQRAQVDQVYLPNAENWVAVDPKGRVLGFIGLLDGDEGGHVGGLFVEPGAHGRGIGRALLEHAALLKGTLTVEVYEANRAATFYRRCGFVDVGRKERDDEGRPLPLLVMRRG